MPKYTCNCGARYRFPDEAAGKRSRCKKCGLVFTLPAADDGIIPFAEEDPFMAEAVDAAAVVKQGALQLTPESPGAAHGSMEGAGVSAVAPPARGFASNVLWTFLFPTEVGDLFTFLGIWLLMGVTSVMTLVAGFGLLGIIAFCVYLLLVGWYCAYRFSVIESAAAGDDNLPNMEFDSGWIGDAVGALFRWIGSWLFVLLPALAYRLYYYKTLPPAPAMGAGGGPSLWFEDLKLVTQGIPGILSMQTDGFDLFKALVVAGLFIWPFVILCVGIGGLESLYRFDLMMATVVRTIGPYAATVALIVGASALGYVLEQMAAGRLFGGAMAGGGGIGAIIQAGVVFQVVTLGLTIYLDIVLMRLIGLYYHHFKAKFAWDWG